MLVELLGDTALFGARFRENAARALLMPRRQPGKRTPLYLQRLRARDLLEVAKKHPEFPVLVETYRECLRDIWDLPRLGRLLGDVESGRIEVAVRHLPAPSPFAKALLFGFVVNFLYQDDLPKAERRAQLLPVGRGLLASVLGQARAAPADRSVDPGGRGGARAAHLAAAARPRRRRAARPADVARPARADGRDRERLVEPDRAASLIEELGARAAHAWRPLVCGRRSAAPSRPRWKAIPAAVEALTRRALRAGGPESAPPSPNVPVLSVELVARRARPAGGSRRGGAGPLSSRRSGERAGVGRPGHARSAAAALAGGCAPSIRPVDAEQYGRFLLALAAPVAREPARRAWAGSIASLAGLAGFPLPDDLFEREILGRRVRAYQPAWLDRRISDGDWAFSGSGGTSRMRVALWPRADLGRPAPPTTRGGHARRRG